MTHRHWSLWSEPCAPVPPLALELDETCVLPAIVWAEAPVEVRIAADAARAARRLARLEAVRKVTGIEDFTPLFAEHYADIFS